MIGHDLRCQDIAFQLGGCFPDDPHQAIPNRSYQDLPPSLRTEDDVVVQQEDASFFPSIGLTHDGILTLLVLFVKLEQHKMGRIHPTPEVCGLSASFL